MQDKVKRIVGVPLSNLAAWREEALMSRRELAYRAGLAYETLRAIENGQVAKWGTIDRLADALGITREQLVNRAPRKRKASAA